MQPNSEMTIILAQEQPRTVIAHSADKKLLRKALEEIDVTYSTPNWQATFTLANAAISTADHSIILMSDGGLSNNDYTLYSSNFEFIRIGQKSENIGINTFSATGTKTGVELFVKLTNYGPQNAILILSIYQGGALIDAERVEIPSSTSLNHVFSGLPDAATSYEARLSPALGEEQLDYFSADDIAYVAYTPRQTGDVLLISPGNFFLEQFLGAMPDINAFRILPGQIGDLPKNDFSVYIYDGIFSGNLPNGNLLLINPPPNDLFTVNGATQEFGRVEVKEHSLMRFVEWQNIQIQEIAQIELPIWGESLIESEAGPVVFVGEHEGRRIAVVSFDIHKSDLPLHITFPILFSNLITYLNPPTIFDAPNGIQIGESLNITPGPEVEELTITVPDGHVYNLTSTEGGALFTNTRQPGIYSVSTNIEDHIEYFAVNLFQPIESKIAPQITLHLSSTGTTSHTQPKSGILELWPLLGALGVLVLVIEWHIYQQRQLPFNIWHSLRKRFKGEG